MKDKYTYLLEHDDVKRWYDSLAAKSLVTAEVYLRTLVFYCELNQTDPKALLKVAKTKAFRDSFTDFIRRMEKKGKACENGKVFETNFKNLKGIIPEIILEIF